MDNSAASLIVRMAVLEERIRQQQNSIEKLEKKVERQDHYISNLALSTDGLED